MATSSKDLERVVRRAERAGWRKEIGAKSGKLFSPDGQNVVGFSISPSDVNAHHQLERELKRKGFVETAPPERTPVVTAVGEALQAAQRIDEQKQDHTASGATRRYFRENPGKTMTVEEVSLVVMARFPKANKIAVQQAINQLAKKGELTRVSRGMYRWSEGSKSDQTSSPPPEPEKKDFRSLTGDSSLDEQLEKVDTALVALAAIEEVVKDIYAKVAKLAELKRMLG